MKLEALLTAAWLASTATAIGPASPEQPPRLKGKAEKIANWQWPNPFASAQHKKFTASCEATGTFPAEQHLLDDLSVEDSAGGLLAYRDALKSVFAMREYPGSWDGVDPHGYDRRLLTMDYEAMPLKVREWIEHQERTDGPGKGLFAVYPRPAPGTRVMNTVNVPQEVPVPEKWRNNDDRRVVLFAPGALYEILPLWVADGSKCVDQLLDLSKYSGKLVDGGVVAYTVRHTTPRPEEGDRSIEIEIKAQVLKLKEGETMDEAAEAAEAAEEAAKAKEAKKKSDKTGETESGGKDEL